MRVFQSLTAIQWIGLTSLLAALLTYIPGCGASSGGSDLPSRSARPKTEQIGQLEVEDENGAARKIQDYADGSHLVVVVSRGYHGSVCPFCCAQTQTLASNYAKFEQLGAKVLVVFPVEQPSDKSYSSELVDAARIVMKSETAQLPFPIAFDVQLAAVDQLGIRAQLAKPATYIIDKRGKLRYSHVGADPADRPRVKTLLEQLRAMQ